MTTVVMIRFTLFVNHCKVVYKISDKKINKNKENVTEIDLKDRKRERERE